MVVLGVASNQQVVW